MAEIKLNDNEKKARKLLTNLRADRNLSYRETLQEILSLLGSDYRVPSSEIAKGMLAAMIYTTFDYGNYRNIMFVALCLSREYSMASATDRRRSYLEDYSIEFYGREVSEDAVRKDEEKCFDQLAKRIALKIEQSDKEYIDALLLYAKENRFVKRYLAGSWSYDPVRIGHYSTKPPRSIYKLEVELDKADEKLADGIRFKVEAGVNDIDSSTIIMPGATMSEAYYLKYHDRHSIMVYIGLIEYTEYGSYQHIVYDVTISKVVDGGLLRIESSCGQEGLVELLNAFDNPVLIYDCVCGPDPTNTYDYLLSIPGSVVFHYGKIQKFTDEDPDEYEGLGLRCIDAE